MKKVYKLKNLTCANCAKKFENKLKAINSVSDAKVNFTTGKLEIFGDITIEQIEKAGDFDNIKVVLNDFETERKYEKIKLLFSTVLFLSAIILGKHSEVGIILLLSSTILSGYKLFLQGIKGLIKLNFEMKTLMTIAISGAIIIGEYSEAAMVIILFSISEYLESKSTDSARNSIKDILNLKPLKALIKDKDEFIFKNIEDIEIGDIAVVKAGEQIPVDGYIIRGSSSIDEKVITGESKPKFKRPGDYVFAATLNLDGAIEVDVVKKHEDNTISKIIELVENAQNKESKAQRFIDSFAGIYTPFIILISLLIAFVPILLGQDFYKWIYQALSVLVVGCPCALVISTPISVVSAIGNAARKGILVKGGIYMEELSKIKSIAFDKTATLTEGKFKVNEIYNFNEYDFKILYSIERNSNHPISKAIIEYGKINKIEDLFEFESITEIPGKGLIAQKDGIKYYVGNYALISENEIYFSEKARKKMEEFYEFGYTNILFAYDNEIKLILGISDNLRSDSKDLIEELSSIGIRSAILTGDNHISANSIATKLKIDLLYSQLLPQDKLKTVNALKKDYGKIAMVGDGINDAPALAAADIGISMGSGATDIANKTSDIILMNEELKNIPYIIKLSKKMIRIIKENITLALLFKIFALLLVIPGLLTMWIAVLADVGTTILVTLNSLRLRK